MRMQMQPGILFDMEFITLRMVAMNLELQQQPGLYTGLDVSYRPISDLLILGFRLAAVVTCVSLQRLHPVDLLLDPREIM